MKTINEVLTLPRVVLVAWIILAVLETLPAAAHAGGW
jgi:hypothetical protein